jgi:hypothetical protein
MTRDPWHRKATRNRNATMLLRGLAVILLVLYVSFLVGARFA